MGLCEPPLSGRRRSACASSATAGLQTSGLPPLSDMSPNLLLSTAAMLGLGLLTSSAHTFKKTLRQSDTTVDATAAPDLAEWSEKRAFPIVAELYRKIVEMLKSEGFTAPESPLSSVMG